nr:U32 family peptidase C-terminal domain-containing protein [Eubacterium sp.]
VELMKPDGTNTTSKVLEMWDEWGANVESCPHPQQRIRVKLEAPLNEFDIIRKKDEISEE